MKKTNKTFYVSTEGDGELLYLDKLQQLINNGDYHYTVKFVKKKIKPTSFVKSNFNGIRSFHIFIFVTTKEIRMRILKNLRTLWMMSKKQE